MENEAAIKEQDDLAGIEPTFHEVVKKYGRPLFALVMNAGLAGQATQVLAAIVEKHHSRGGAHALGVLAQSFNQISNEYVKRMGWEAGMIAQCDRDVQLAFAGKIQIPGQSPIVLDS